MLNVLFLTAAFAYIAMAGTSFGLSRGNRLVGAFWLELLSVIPAAVALVATVAKDSAGWIVALWVFNGACSVLSAWFMAKRIQHEAEHRAWADSFLR